MILLFLIVLPLLTAAVIWIFRKNTNLPVPLLTISALTHSALTALIMIKPEWNPALPAGLQNWIGTDSVSQFFLAVTSFLFSASALHTCHWLTAEKKAAEGHQTKLLSEAVFTACLCGFLSTMTLVVCARNLGLLWVAVEATTLVSAPLILFHKSAQSLEAMWKYLLICSVGIGLALFGTMLLAISARNTGITTLQIDLLKQVQLDPGWFKAAFIFILAGYGTKMGLAPFHTWLPDAHSEAPGTVSALLSGALLNCSFLGIIRYFDIAPAQLIPFCRELMIALGILSLTVAAFFIIRQTDYKRMLAYSSVEHMGLIAIMWVVSSQEIALIHICGHSLLKMTLFLVAGNFLLACGTRKIADVGGLFASVPKNSVIWLTAILMICGMPPSPLFFSEYLLICCSGPVLGGVILILLFMVFSGMTGACLKMVMGESGIVQPSSDAAKKADSLFAIPALTLSLITGAGIALVIMLARSL